MIVAPYAGPGGGSEGLRALGLTDIGIEHDPAACATRAAAGHRTIRADVTTWPLDRLVGRVDGLVITPPCQAFSTAGQGAGRAVIGELTAAIRSGDWTGPAHDDERIRHVLEVGRWVETIRPGWVVCEQVPPVLPIWQTYVDRWRRRYGWSAWAGVLCAADFGVPQTRRRAFLIARTDGAAALPPAPTHCDGGALTLDGELRPWITMAGALGWDDDVTVEHQRGRGMAERHGERPKRPATQPAPSITAGANRRLVLDRRQQTEGEPVRLVDCDTEPAPTLTGTAGAKSQWVFRSSNGNGADRRAGDGTSKNERPLDRPATTIDGTGNQKWVHQRPATTIVGDELCFGPHAGSAGEPQSSNAIRLTIRDALILQGFPPDYPVQGTRTAQFRQVGDAVPPPLAAAVIAATVGHTRKAAA